MKLAFLTKFHYGRVRFYPTNKAAELLCGLIGAKTLSKEQIKTLKDMGATVTVEEDPERNSTNV